MVLFPWWPWWGESVVVYIGALLAWALALYVILRGGWRRIPVLTTAASAPITSASIIISSGTYVTEPSRQCR